MLRHWARGGSVIRMCLQVTYSLYAVAVANKEAGLICHNTRPS